MQKYRGASSQPRQVEYDSISRHGARWSGTLHGLTDDEVGALVGQAQVDEHRRLRLIALREAYVEALDAAYPGWWRLVAMGRSSGLRDRELTSVEMDDLAGRLVLLRRLDSGILHASPTALEAVIDDAIAVLLEDYRARTGQSEPPIYLDQPLHDPPTPQQLASARRYEHAALAEAWRNFHGRTPTEEEDRLLSEVAEPLGQIEAETLARMGARSHEDLEHLQREAARSLRDEVLREPTETGLSLAQIREATPVGVDKERRRGLALKPERRKPGPKPREKPRQPTAFEERMVELKDHRDRVYTAVRAHPGTGITTLKKMAGLNYLHCLRAIHALEARDLIETRGKRNKRYYPAEPVPESGEFPAVNREEGKVA